MVVTMDKNYKKKIIATYTLKVTCLVLAFALFILPNLATADIISDDFNNTVLEPF